MKQKKERAVELTQLEQQKEKWKIHIYLETKQHTLEQTINRSRKKSHNISNLRDAAEAI